mgnify:CR=1 FL=1
MGHSVIYGKSLNFALRIVKAYQYLSDEKGERILSKQLLRSGTAIGAMVCEAEFAESASDFIHKLHIALKEANETAYWLLLLYKSDYRYFLLRVHRSGCQGTHQALGVHHKDQQGKQPKEKAGREDIAFPYIHF